MGGGDHHQYVGPACRRTAEEVARAEQERREQG